MSAADKLAQVLAEHRFRVIEFDGAVCSCGAVVTPSVNSTTIKAAWPAHQAAVVLAHLTAEGCHGRLERMAQAMTERYQNGKATLITQHEREQQEDGEE